MPRRKPAPTVPGKPPIDLPPQPPPAASGEKSNAPERLSFAIDGDGQPLWDRMHPDTRRKVERLTGGAKATPGDSGANAAILAGGLTMALGVLLKMVDTIVLARGGVPRDVIDRVAAYTPDELATVESALRPVLAKHESKILGKYGEEIALVAVIGSITMSKIGAARVLMAQRPAPVIVHPSSKVDPDPVVPIVTDIPPVPEPATTVAKDPE